MEEFLYVIMRIICSISIFIGLLYCFWGYKLFKVVLAIMGFFLGAFIGVLVVLTANANYTGFLFVIMGGIAGALLLYNIYRLGVFILGASLGVVIGFFISLMITQQVEPIVLLILAIAGGVTALFLEKFIIIFATAFNGAYLIVTSSFYLFASRGDIISMIRDSLYAENTLLLLFFVLILGIMGMLYQYGFLHAGSIKNIGNLPDNIKSTVLNDLRKSDAAEAKPNTYKPKEIQDVTKNKKETFLEFPIKLQRFETGDIYDLVGILNDECWKATLGRETIKGLAARAHLKVPNDEKTVSRKQAEFYLCNNKVYLKNLTDTNKSVVNERELDVGEKMPLNIDDEIKFGYLEFKIIG